MHAEGPIWRPNCKTSVKKMGLERMFRLTRTSFATQGHYVAFPKATVSPDVVKQVQAALDIVKVSGKLEQIVNKYTTVNYP